MKSTLFYSSCLVAIAFSVKLWVIEAYTIPSASMQPTLKIGDKVWIKKLPLCAVKKDEILAFHSPLGEKVDYIKRCAGLANDSVASVNGQFLLQKNNPKAFAIPRTGQTIHLNKENFPFYQPLLQHYEKVQAGFIGDLMYINNAPSNSYTFTQNYFYMIGDNSSDSYDSRSWGLVPESHLIGKAFYISAK
jgi:signal peptidase I